MHPDREVRAQQLTQPAAGTFFRLRQFDAAFLIQTQAALGAELDADVAALAPLGRDFQAHAVRNVRGRRGFRGRAFDYRRVGSRFLDPAAPEAEGVEVDRDGFLRHECAERLFPVVGAKVQRRGQGANQHHVGGALIAEYLGHAGGVDRIAFGHMRPHFGRGLARVAHGRARAPVEAGERRHDALGVADENAGIGLEVGKPAQAFGPFKRDQDVGFAFRDGGRPYLRAEAHMAEHGAAALGHTVHFALLDLVALGLG